jgi:hypothetical protein
MCKVMSIMNKSRENIKPCPFVPSFLFSKQQILKIMEIKEIDALHLLKGFSVVSVTQKTSQSERLKSILFPDGCSKYFPWIQRLLLISGANANQIINTIPEIDQLYSSYTEQESNARTQILKKNQVKKHQQTKLQEVLVAILHLQGLDTKAIARYIDKSDQRALALKVDFFESILEFVSFLKAQSPQLSEYSDQAVITALLMRLYTNGKLDFGLIDQLKFKELYGHTIRNPEQFDQLLKQNHNFSSFDSVIANSRDILESIPEPRHSEPKPKNDLLFTRTKQWL